MRGALESGAEGDLIDETAGRSSDGQLLAGQQQPMVPEQLTEAGEIKVEDVRQISDRDAAARRGACDAQVRIREMHENAAFDIGEPLIDQAAMHRNIRRRARGTVRQGIEEARRQGVDHLVAQVLPVGSEQLKQALASRPLAESSWTRPVKLSALWKCVRKSLAGTAVSNDSKIPSASQVIPPSSGASALTMPA